MAAVTVGHTNPHIWEMDESEASILADMWLDMGKHSVKAAHTVRVMVNLKKKFAAGVILVSRVFASMDYVMTQGIDIPRPRKRKV